MNSISIDLADELATQRLGHALQPLLIAGDVVLLNGDLGAGKSSLARAYIQASPHPDGRLYEEEVPSPTFTLVQTYERQVAEIWHFDLYRLGDPEELFELGWEEASLNAICLIEWPERLGFLKPSQHLHIQLDHKNEGRLATLSWHGVSVERQTQLVESLEKQGLVHG